MNYKLNFASLMMPVLVLMTGCTKSEFLTPSEDMSEKQDVSLSFFETSITGFDDKESRAATRADVSEIYKRLDVAFIPENKPAEGKDSVYHRNTDNGEDINSLHVALPVGKYRLVAVASKAPEAMDIKSETEIRFPDGVITDMASYYKEIEVRKDAPTEVCTMNRAIAAFDFVCRDKCDTKIYNKVIFELSGNCGTAYDATDVKSDDANGYTRTFDSSVLTQRNISRFRTNALLCSDKEDIDITVRIFKADGSIYKTYRFEDVTLERGKVTTYTGTVFAEEGDLDFTVSDSITMPESDYGKEYSDDDLVTNDTQY